MATAFGHAVCLGIPADFAQQNGGLGRQLPSNQATDSSIPFVASTAFRVYTCTGYVRLNRDIATIVAQLNRTKTKLWMVWYQFVHVNCHPQGVPINNSPKNLPESTHAV